MSPEAQSPVITAVVPEHDCPYRTHAERLRLQGAYGLNAFVVLNPRVENAIANIHGQEGECPPTHPGGNMTMPGAEWADFVQTYTLPADVI